MSLYEYFILAGAWLAQNYRELNDVLIYAKRCYFQAARQRQCWREFSIIPLPAHFVNRNFAQRSFYFNPKICAFCLYLFKKFFAIIYLQVKGSDLKVDSANSSAMYHLQGSMRKHVSVNSMSLKTQ